MSPSHRHADAFHNCSFPVFEVAMIGGVLKRVFGSSNDRMLTRLQGKVDAINAVEADIQKLLDVRFHCIDRIDLAL